MFGLLMKTEALFRTQGPIASAGLPEAVCDKASGVSAKGATETSRSTYHNSTFPIWPSPGNTAEPLGHHYNAPPKNPSRVGSSSW